MIYSSGKSENVDEFELFMFILRSYFAEKYEKVEKNHVGIHSNDLLVLEYFLESLVIVQYTLTPNGTIWYHIEYKSRIIAIFFFAITYKVLIFFSNKVEMI